MFGVLFDVIEANNHTFTISIIISANPVCMEIYLDLVYTHLVPVYPSMLLVGTNNH